MTTFLFTLHTPPTKICRYAGETRNLEFTGTRGDLFKHIRYISRTYERLIEVKVKEAKR